MKYSAALFLAFVSTSAFANPLPVGEWNQLDDVRITVKSSVLMANKIARGIGNTPDEAIARALDYCGKAVDIERTKGNRVMAYRGRVTQASPYLFVAECDLQILAD